MGRKLDMKKIENKTKCQVTYSKRRSSILKKASEISSMCEVDIAFVAFSPSGRVSKFSNRKRIEDVLEQYVNLPTDKRLSHIYDIEGKMEKLNKISHIHGDNRKLSFLANQIENMELQIKKSNLELHMLEKYLREYELDPDQQDQPSMDQLSQIELNLNHSLQRVLARKDGLQTDQNQIEAMLNEPQNPFSSTFNENGQASSSINPDTTRDILMQLDPWISPYSARVRNNILHDLIDQSEKQRVTNANQGSLDTSPNFLSIHSNMSNFTQEYPNLSGSDFTPDVQILLPPIPSKQPFIVDQPMLNFQDQYNVDAWNNNSSALILDSTHMSSTHDSDNFQDSRFSPNGNPINVGMSQSLYDEMGTPNLTNQLSSMEGQFNWDYNGSFINGNPINMESNNSFFNADHVNMDSNSSFGKANPTNMDFSNNFIIENPSNDNVQLEGGYSGINRQEMQKIEPPLVNLYNNNKNSEVVSEDNAAGSSSAIQKVGSWDNLLLDENFNFQHDF